MENLEGEIWKDIEMHEGLYQISTFGRIKSFYMGGRWGLSKRTNPIILKNFPVRAYLGVMLVLNGKMKLTKVHRLVAMAFIPNPENKPHVNHKDRNPHNNHVWNLEWATGMENLAHSRAGMTTASNYLGVTKVVKGGTIKWVARITVAENVRKYLGRYNTPIEASNVVIAEMKRLGIYHKYVERKPPENNSEGSNGE